MNLPLVLVNATDLIELVTSAAADVDVLVGFLEATLSSGVIVKETMVPGRQATAITTAATTTILSSPAVNRVRGVKGIHVRNKDTADSTDVTVRYNTGTAFELHKVTLAPGEALEYIPGVGWFHFTNKARLNTMLVTTADVVNATTAFADITGLTVPVKAGKTYLFECTLLYITNATTTGARFGANGPASPTDFRIGQTTASTPGIAATNIAVGVATAYDTAMAASTTGPGATPTIADIDGVIVPSADGTFAMRFASEVAVASGLTVHRGSWLHIREADNA